MTTTRQWAIYHAGALLLATVAVLLLQSARPFAIVGTLSFLGYVAFNQQRSGILRHPANWVTGARIALACLVGWFYPSLHDYVLFGLGLVILLTDWVDGYLARRFDSSSEFGAYFDMETDAFFIALYATILWVSGFAGVWVLALGAMRYLNVFALFVLRQLHKPEPRLFIARFIAVMVMIAVMAPFVAPRLLYLPYLVLTVVLLCGSFSWTFQQHVRQSG